MDRSWDDNLSNRLVKAEMYVFTQETQSLTVDKVFRARFTMRSVHKSFLQNDQLHRTLVTPS